MLAVKKSTTFSANTTYKQRKISPQNHPIIFSHPLERVIYQKWIFETLLASPKWWKSSFVSFKFVNGTPPILYIENRLLHRKSSCTLRKEFLFFCITETPFKIEIFRILHFLVEEWQVKKGNSTNFSVHNVLSHPPHILSIWKNHFDSMKFHGMQSINWLENTKSRVTRQQRRNTTQIYSKYA